MNNQILKDELRNIISGKSKVRYGTIIQAITHYLRESSQTSQTSKNSKYFKNEEAKSLIKFAEANKLFITIDISKYVSEGAEQKVYLQNKSHVIKLNDSIYYESWHDYFNNLLIHNFFFPDTAYNLIGFTMINGELFAVVQQAYVEVTSITDLKHVKVFMKANGFINNRNNDYINHELGLIIEDLHDENVLTRNNTLYFIDTVIYLTESFFE